MGWEQSRRPAGSSRRNSRSSESTPFRRATGRGAASPTTMVGMKSLRGVWLVIVVNTAGAVIPTILLQIFRPGATSHDMWMNFRFSLVYSYCIGTLAFAVMGRLAERLHGRSRSWYVAAMFLSLAVLAVVGSLAANLIFLAIGWATKSELAPEFIGGVRIAIFITILIGAAVTVFETLSHRLREVTRSEEHTSELQS